MYATSHFRTLCSGLGALVLVAESWAQDTSKLVEQLGASKYQARENAYQSLRKVVHRDDVMERLRGPFADPEIDQRANQLRTEYVNQLKPTNLPTLPWIDMLPATGYPDGPKIMRDYLHRSGGHGRPPLWPGDMEATRLWVNDLVVQRVPRDKIVNILNSMGEVQKQSTWYKDYIKALEK